MSEADGAGLRRAIIDDPRDDVPRLVYADWLDENGRPERAEFIRLGVRVARLGLPDGPCKEGCPCGGAGPRMARLLKASGDAWSPPLPGEGPGDAGFVWRRGFPDSVRLSLAGWVRLGPVLVWRHPLTRVELSDWRPYLREHGGGYDRPTISRRAECPTQLWVEVLRLCGSEFPAHDSVFHNRVELTEEEATLGDASTLLSDACLAWARSADAGR